MCAEPGPDRLCLVFRRNPSIMVGIMEDYNQMKRQAVVFSVKWLYASNI